MICANCQLEIKNEKQVVSCTACNKHMHKDCAYQCIECGAYLCDRCALEQRFKCNECRNVEMYTMEFISSTMFESYEKCPYAFKHEHILKTLDEDERENKYSTTGTLLHDIFDKWSQIRPLDEEALETALKELYAGFDLINIKLFEDGSDRETHKKRCIQTLKNWFDREKDRPLPLYTEKEHFFEVEGLDVKVRATVDRINGDPDDMSTWEVEDYKTGKVYSSTMLNNNMQLPTYAMAVKAFYGEYPTVLRLVFPQHTDAKGIVKTREFERISDDVYVCDVPRGGTYSFSITERKQKMIEIYDHIKRGEFPLNTKNSRFCEGFCALGKAGKCAGLDTRWNLANQRGY
jgi:RecB family exonuclease